LITDAEILELETLLKEREIDMSRNRLCVLNEDTNPNYKLLYNAISSQEYDEKGELVSANCKVWNKSCAEPIEVTVYLKEYISRYLKHPNMVYNIESIYRGKF
jgi:hypothetical protein